MAQRFVGVDLGTQRVKVVVATSGMRGFSVLRVYEEPVRTPVGEGTALDAAVDTAIDMLREHDLSSDTVGVSLPGSAASYRLLQFPFTDARRIAQTLAFEADGQFPVPLESLRYDHVVARGLGTGGRALVVAVDADRAQAVSNKFSAAGIRIRLLTAAPMAIAQALEPVVPPILLQEGQQEDRLPVVLVMDVGDRSTEFTALGDKGPVMARSVRLGGRGVTAALSQEYGMGDELAEKAKQRDGFVPHRGMGELTPEQLKSGTVVARATEELVRELEHTRLWLHSSHGYEVTKILLAGGGAHLTGLAAYLGEQVGLPVGEVGTVISAAVKSSERDWTDYVVALGAAMGAARRPLIQLHRAEGGAGDDTSFLQRRMSTLMTISVAIMAFGALDTIAQVKALEAERTVRAEELATATREVFGEEVTDAAEVVSRLAEVDGQDLTSLVPTRGALELLGLITDAAKPQDAGEAAAAAPTPPGATDMDTPPTGAGLDSADSESDTDGEDAVPENKPLLPVADASGGIRVDDELVFSVLDVRARKVELTASAARSSAQDRLAIKLANLGCLTNISKGKVRDQNERKVFDMSMDNACFTGEADATAEEGT